MSAASGSARSPERGHPLPINDTEPMGAREMLAIAFKHRVKVALALILPPLLAVALAMVLPKSYRAQSDIVVKTGREYMAQGNSESAPLTAPTSTKQENINSEIALITSRAVIERTINAIGLTQLYPEIVADPPSSGTVMDAAVLRFLRNLAVEPVKLSNVISLSFDAATPAQARRVLDALVQSYVRKHMEVYASRRTEGYRDSIDIAMSGIRELEQRRAATKLQDGIYDADAQRRALIQQQFDAEGRLEEARSKQQRLQARSKFLATVREQVPTTTVAASTEQSDARAHAAAVLIDLRQQEAAMSARLGDANPDLWRLRHQIDAVSRIATSTRKERNSTTAPSPLRQYVEQEVVAAAAELSTTGTDIERLQAFAANRRAQLAEMEHADLDLRDLSLQIDVATQNLRAMQGRFEQARANEQTDLARQVSVVQVAAANGSERPVGPRMAVFGAVGLLAGVLLAGTVALLAILLSKTALTGDAAERRIGLPVLAVVPFRDDEDGQAFGTP